MFACVAQTRVCREFYKYIAKNDTDVRNAMPCSKTDLLIVAARRRRPRPTTTRRPPAAV